MLDPVKRLRRQGERGAVAVMVALSMTALLIASAMVLDFGLVRIDRQVDKSGADAATKAGLYGLMGADGKAHPFRGVCTAISYLAKNDVRFSSVTGGAGSWTDGASPAATVAADCTSAATLDKTCTPGNSATWAKYTWTGTYQGQALKVQIESGYALAGSAFPEENLPGVAADVADSAQGCDQLAVIVTHNRKPGLGSLATSADLVSRVRTVGRIYSGPGGDAPAMLLLKRTGCPILNTGSNGGGSSIHVYGGLSLGGNSQPGTIHADSDGSGCSGSIFDGKASNGIVAYAAPQAANPALADPTKPGLITSVAGTRSSIGIGTVRDSATSVYSSAAKDEAGAASATRKEPQGRTQVTRSVIDSRYLGLGTTPQVGIKGIVTTAQSAVFSKTVNNAAQALTAGFERYVNSCNPSAVDLLGVTSTSNLWIDCTANGGFTGTLPILARRVVFAGSIQPPNSAVGVNLPNAEKVYVFGDPTKNAISLSTGSVLNIHTAGNLTGSACSTTQSANKAVLVVKAGQVKQTGGTLRLCYTTAVLMGNDPAGCLPTTEGNAPTATPCSGTTGDGHFSQNGGDVDWTAPNQYDAMNDTNGNPLPTSPAAWWDVNGPEDMALWAESGTDAGHSFSMNGQGALRIQGVYMAPNAEPFSIGGGATQNLVNAQYIASSISLNGNTTALTMKVDPNSAVQLPKLRLVGLVR